MNKVLALFLVALLASQVSANFLKMNFFDNGEDHGEDSGEFSGSWNDRVYTDNGEFVDSGEFDGYVYQYDNGEFQVSATYNRYVYHREDNGEN